MAASGLASDGETPKSKVLLAAETSPALPPSSPPPLLSEVVEEVDPLARADSTLEAVSLRSKEKPEMSTDVRWAEKRWYMEGSRGRGLKGFEIEYRYLTTSININSLFFFFLPKTKASTTEEENERVGKG